MGLEVKQDVGGSVFREVELAGDTTGGETQDRELPQIGQGIQIDARDGVFVVLRTDAERGTVDVLQISGIRQIEGGIPLGSVRILKDHDPMAELQTSRTK